MSDERRKVLHEWTLAGYHCRIVEVQPGIVSAEQAMDDDVRGRLWMPKLNPMGWQNEMIQLSSALATSEAAREKAEAERLTMARYMVEREHADTCEVYAHCERCATFDAMDVDAAGLLAERVVGAARVSKGEEHGS